MGEKREEKQSQIFGQALKLFAAFGFKKTTIEDVAGKLGMTKGNLYFYVKNKQDLYEKTIHWALTQWQAHVLCAVEIADSPGEKFTAMARSAIGYIESSPVLQDLLKKDPGIFTLDRGNDRFPQANRAALDIIASILDQGIEKKVFFIKDTEATARYLFSIYMMFLIQTYVCLDQKDFHKIFEAALELNLKGLSSSQSS